VAVAAAAGALAAWRRWRPFWIEIEGSSMRPTLEPGDWAVALRTRRIGVGQVVVVEHPERRGFELVKRITVIPGEGSPDGRELDPGQVWVEGDAPGASTDSRSFGPIGADGVRGRVVLVWWPPARWRRV
jgi:nickel-type superoxide dismutase maturation protease